MRTCAWSFHLDPREELPHRAVAESFGAYAGEALNLPDDAVPPDAAFLAKQRAGVVNWFTSKGWDSTEGNKGNEGG